MKTCVNFTAAQVMAALRGEVVTVREAVKFPPPYGYTDEGLDVVWEVKDLPCPYTIGSTLWVRETYMDYHDNGGTGYWYKATEKGFSLHIISVFGSWKSPVTMPRWASRLNVTVQSVTVEQVASGWEWVVEMVKAVQE